MKVKKVKFTTTLKLLKESGACESGYNTLVKSLPKNHSMIKQINLLHILESNGVDHCLWALRALKEYTLQHKKIVRLILADIVEMVEPNFSKLFPNNLSVKNVIKLLRKGTIQQLKEAARAADSAARAAFGAADSVARAADSVARAADSAAYSAAYSAARAAYSAARAADSAARAAFGAADSVARAAFGAADSAAYSAARDKQKEIIKKYLK